VDVWFILVIALAPGLFWLWYFYKQDVYEPEPLSLLVKMFFLGLVATVIAFTLEDLIGLFVSGILFAALAAPVVEESAKFFMVREFVYKKREFDEPMDGIVYATATALGFATLENVLYLLDQPYLSSLVVTGTIRAILSVPGHALFGVFWGYSLGIAKFRPPGKRSAIILGGLILGIAVHGLFNFLLEESYLGFAILILVIIPCIWWFAEEDIRAALLEEAAVLGKSPENK
jgi:RsiW-degrading membrane proteinase PrsW (M82 family)